MSRFFRATLLPGLALIPAVALPAVPDPVLSDTPECAAFAPDGGMKFDGQIIGVDGNPIGGEEVRLVFNAGCTDMLECPDPGTQPTTLATTSDALGNFSFSPGIGGCCVTTRALECHADPGDVTMFPLYDHIASPDNGDTAGTSHSDLQVTTADFVRFSQAFNSSNPCDMLITDRENPAACTPLVTTEDFVRFAMEFAATCP